MKNSLKKFFILFLAVVTATTSFTFTAPGMTYAVNYPTIYTYTLEDYGITTKRTDWYDKQVFLSTLQGIVNQKGPKLYVFYQYHNVLANTTEFDANNSTQFWWDKMRQRGNWLYEYNVVNLTSLDDVVNTFKDDLNGLVAWDPKVDATVNVATTIAGVEKTPVIMYGGELYNKYTSAPFDLPVIRNLNNQFSGANAKTDAYIWAKNNYLDTAGKANQGLLGFVEDAWSRHMSTDGADPGCITRDYLVKNKAFVYDLSMWNDEVSADSPNSTQGLEYSTLISIFQSCYTNYGAVWPIKLLGFTPWWDKYCNQYGHPSSHTAGESEWKMVEEFSQYHITCFNQDLQNANASFHSWAPVGSAMEPKQVSPTRTPLSNKTYICFFHGDWDGSPMRGFYYQWEDPKRGSIPIGWGTAPNMKEDYPDIIQYYYNTSTSNDYWWAESSGAGYTNPGYWQNLQVWENYNKYWYEKMGFTMTGFLLNGNAGNASTVVEEAYSRFSHDGICGDLNLPRWDVRTNNTSIVRREIDITNGSVTNACAAITSYVQQFSPGNQPVFVYARSSFAYPYYHEQVMNKLKTDYPSYNYEVVDPYTFFSLVRQYDNNRGNDAIDIGVGLPENDFNNVTKLIAGEKYDVSITVRNVGSNNWNKFSSYSLASSLSNQFIWSDWENGGQSFGPTEQRAFLSDSDFIAPQQTKTLKFKITAPSTAGTYNFGAYMIQDGVETFGSTISRSIEVINPPALAAKITNISVPDYMEEDTTANVSVTFKNVGSETWTKAAGHKLASLAKNIGEVRADDNQFSWNDSINPLTDLRVELDDGDNIAPGQSKTFVFSIRAPKTRGTYTLSGRMLKEGVSVFPAKFTKDVRVIPPGRSGFDCEVIGETVPKYMKAGEKAKVSITVKNLGTETLSWAQSYRLGAYNTNQFIYSDFKDGGYSNSVSDQRVYLADGESIRPEEVKTFEFEITAPSTPGTYVFSTDVVHDGTAWCGHPKTYTIVVGGDYDAVFTNSNIPTVVAAGSKQRVRLEVTNAGKNDWTRADAYSLACTANNQFFFSEFSNGGQSSSVSEQRAYMSENEKVPQNARKEFAFNIVAPSTPGIYRFEVQMIRDGVMIFGETKTVYIQVVEPYKVSVNCGGSAYTDSHGVVWSADQAYSQGSWGYSGTTSALSTTNGISFFPYYEYKTDYIEQESYRSYRKGDAFSYKFDVPNGTYRVSLGISELEKTAAGQRLFGMKIEDKDVWHYFDAYLHLFHQYYADYTELEIPVSDGQLNLNFTGNVSQAIINAIKIERLN